MLTKIRRRVITPCSSNIALTFLHRSRLPSHLWLQAIELILGQPNTTATALQQTLNLGSYRTGWRMARIIREALVSTEWPLLSGEIELCDIVFTSPGKKPVSAWFASERRRSSRGGLIRCWRGGRNLKADFNRFGLAFHPKALIVTPPGVYAGLRSLGIAQRSEPLGKADALPATAALAGSFRSMLRDRHHQILSAKTCESYLGEFVFRHNAAVLGWSAEEQCERVMARLRAPRLSA